MTSKRLLRVLQREILTPPPIWLMRQAGRYLPEYRELRASSPTFLDFCYSPKLAAEATLQPIRRFGLDAAILFSDILVVPDALGQPVSFETGEGPRLEPLDASLTGISTELRMERLEPVLETIRLSREALAPEVALIGFCGAPWTVATYMVAGRGTGDQQPARLLAYRDPKAFEALIDLLVRASATYLIAQIRAGVDVVQIFDSWAGVLPPVECRRWCLDPLARIVEAVGKACPGTPIIAFPRGANSSVTSFAAVRGVSALGLDTTVDPHWADKAMARDFPLQGNIDPLALLAGGRALDEAVDLTLEAFHARPHIVNLGHGILPATPVAHVEALIRRVRKEFL